MADVSVREDEGAADVPVREAEGAAGLPVRRLRHPAEPSAREV
ncbi:hypothetical protein [Streptomyces eurythermus]